MKISWTIAALACSVTLVEAQTPAPRRPVSPAPTPAPAPTPRPRADRPLLPPSGALLPGFDWLLDAPTPLPPLEPLMPLEPMVPLAPLAPMAVEPLMSLEFEMSPLVPVSPMLFDVTPTPPTAPMAPMPATPFLFDVPSAQGPTTPRPPRPREFDAELRRLTSELDRAETARQRALAAQDRVATREADAALRGLQQELAAAQRAQEAREREILRDIEIQDRALQRDIEAQQRELIREHERMAQQAMRDAEWEHRAMARETELALRSASADFARSMGTGSSWGSTARVTAPAPWAPQDVADSAYRAARELFNRGEWGQAAQAFRALPTRYPNSTYAPEAAYYQAFSLFRIGGTNELREALAALEASRSRYPNARSRAEAATLTTRIRGVLAQRGDAQAAAELARTANEQGVTCDKEEQAVQAEAMNALSRSDAGNVNELITRVLARRDECAIPLRRTAVFLVGNRRDAQAITILSGVARNDPSVEVKVEAINIIGRLPNEEGVTVLEELTRSDDERVQRAAIRALVRHASARARTSVRALVERDDVSERVRSEALSAFDAERATADDVAWLRALFARVTTPTLKTRTLAAIVRVGGPDVDQWLVTIARDDNQPSDIRSTAMRRIGTTLPIVDLARLYDQATQQRFRSEIISVLGKRTEDAATDKLIDIIKNGTDPSLRRSAISAVTNKNDARATQLLLEIINK